MDITKRRAKIDIRESGRSSDYMLPDFVHNCIADCSYCYLRRFTAHGDLKISTNIDQILLETLKFKNKLGLKPNLQTDSKYWVFDIGCNNDFSISANYVNWKHIFDFGIQNDLKFTFATKFVNKKLLEYNSKHFHRIRFSLQPFNMQWTEEGTHQMLHRIQALEMFFKAGYEIHINFSPVIVTPTWEADYKELFSIIKKNVSKDFLNQCKLEVIFLTHNERIHLNNLKKSRDESLLWNPDKQEKKISTYGGENVRYKNKYLYVERFKELLKENLDLPIRYIF